jgi:polysaccharide deacetylase 2 family uncharacterized protein YibQ
MAKRETRSTKKPAKRRTAPARKGQADGLSRRTLLMGGAGVLAAGIGIGESIGHWSKPHLQEAAEAPIEPAQAPVEVASATPAHEPQPLLMEEEPLPTDVYIPPKATPTFAPAPDVPATVPADVTAAMPQPTPPAAVAPAPHLQMPRLAAGNNHPAWQRNARPFVEASGTPVVAIVIDDLGLDHIRTEHALALDHTVTTAFMTYAEKLPQWLDRARAGQHELLVHVPMQPESASVDPGPNALTVSLSQDEILRRLRWGLERMDGYVGVNNHMGSRFTSDAAGMRVVLDELKARGLLFLDSRTTPHSACGPIAASLALPFASRNVFLDDVTTVSAVQKQIQILEGVARRHGTAIGIGHPHDATLTALAEWLPQAEARGVVVAPLTSVMRHAALRA